MKKKKHLKIKFKFKLNSGLKSKKCILFKTSASFTLKLNNKTIIILNVVYYFGLTLLIINIVFRSYFVWTEGQREKVKKMCVILFLWGEISLIIMKVFSLKVMFCIICFLIIYLLFRFFFFFLWFFRKYFFQRYIFKK